VIAKQMKMVANKKIRFNVINVPHVNDFSIDVRPNNEDIWQDYTKGKQAYLQPALKKYCAFKKKLL
jgi:hypothetical protein